MQAIVKPWLLYQLVRQDARTGGGLGAIGTSFYQTLYNIHVSTIKIDGIRLKFYIHFPLNILVDVTV